MIKNGWIRDIEGWWYPLTSIEKIYFDEEGVYADLDMKTIDIYQPCGKLVSSSEECFLYLDEMMGVE